MDNEWKAVNRSSDGVDDPHLGWDIEGPEGSHLGRGQFAHGEDARLIVAAVNSYRRHCADPLAAAEGDLLGEALGTLDELMDAIGAEYGDNTINWPGFMMDAGDRARRVLLLDGRTWDQMPEVKR